MQVSKGRRIFAGSDVIDPRYRLTQRAGKATATTGSHDLEDFGRYSSFSVVKNSG